MNRFTRKEFQEHFGMNSIEELFPAKVLNVVEGTKAVRKNPEVAHVSMEYFSAKRGPQLLHIALQVKYWLSDKDGRVKGKIEYITIFDSLAEQLRHKMEIKAVTNQN